MSLVDEPLDRLSNLLMDPLSDLLMVGYGNKLNLITRMTYSQLVDEKLTLPLQWSEISGTFDSSFD